MPADVIAQARAKLAALETETFTPAAHAPPAAPDDDPPAGAQLALFAAESPRSAAETEALAQLKACDPQTLTARQAQQLLYTLTDLLH